MATTAVDRGLIERRKSCLFLASVLGVIELYFDTYLVCTPFAFLLSCAETAIKRRLKAHPRRGVVLMVLGFCVGTFFDKDLGLFQNWGGTFRSSSYVEISYV